MSYHGARAEERGLISGRFRNVKRSSDKPPQWEFSFRTSVVGKEKNKTKVCASTPRRLRSALSPLLIAGQRAARSVANENKQTKKNEKINSAEMKECPPSEPHAGYSETLSGRLPLVKVHFAGVETWNITPAGNFGKSNFLYLLVREGSKGALVHLCNRKVICTKRQSSADFSQ